MVSVSSEKDCCGCASCKAICPNKCITMRPKTLGALCPEVNLDLCVNCGKCVSVCPMIDSDIKKNGPEYDQQAYAAYSNDSEIRFNGSSGGMFQTFARWALSKGYTVYGAAFDHNMQLRCTSAKTEKELHPLLKSKYLQSDMCTAYDAIHRQLLKDEGVLFTGTPCQVAALKKYVGKEYEKLITVDFFCHGVPSQRFFDECREYEEQHDNITIMDFTFRQKIKNGATPHYYRVLYVKNGRNFEKTKLYFHNAFYAAFQQYVSLRESCYGCRFAGKHRYSDITIGDFHSIDRYVKGIDRFKGVSMVIINSEKGRQLFERCEKTLSVEPVDISELERNKDCFAGGTQRPKHRDKFVEAYENEGIHKLVDLFLDEKKYWKQSIYYSLPHKLRCAIKRLVLGE